MNELIGLFLFRNRLCPLPGIGTLHLKETGATVMNVENKIQNNPPQIEFCGELTSPDHLIDFISERSRISQAEAKMHLINYCDSIKNLEPSGNINLPFAGNFYVNSDGSIDFKTLPPPVEFLPAVLAKQLMRADSSHHLMVGERETSSAEMAAYFSENESRVREKWWLWSIFLFILGAIALALFFSDPNHSVTFGNSRLIDPLTPSISYRITE